MLTADFIHSIQDYAGRYVMVISDLNLGREPIADHILDIVDEIAAREGIQAHHYMIVFTDKDGKWNGYDPVEEMFIPLEQSTWKESVQVFITQQLLLNQY